MTQRIFRQVLFAVEGTCAAVFLCVMAGAALVHSGLLGYRYEPVGRLGGAAYAGGHLYVARFAPAAILRFDADYHLASVTPLRVRSVELKVVDGNAVLMHASQVYTPTENLGLGQGVQPARLRRTLLGRPYAWDEHGRHWVPLQLGWVTLFQMSWPAVPLCVGAIGIGAVCRLLRTHRNPFAAETGAEPPSSQ